jgi:D-xylose transport system permease protein
MAGAVALAVWMKAYTGAAMVVVGIVLVLTNLDKHVVPALITAVCIGAAAGVYNGFLVAKVGIPSFIVTLAFFLAWQGVLQYAITGQPIKVSNYNFWDGLTQNNMSPAWSWVFTIVLVCGYFGYTALRSVRAAARGLSHDSMSLVCLRAGVLAVPALVVTYFANQNRNTNPYKLIEGIPYAAAIPIVLVIICTFALSKTTWGRHLFATGGNAEAARRAGIDVVHIKVTAFVLCSSFGALGGILLASSSHAVSLDLGTGNVLLFAVAAAVIGGTSLFGGRGKPSDALIGAVVITIIPNGLGLRPSIPTQNQVIITGGVLIVAAGIDALSRRNSRTS